MVVAIAKVWQLHYTGKAMTQCYTTRLETDDATRYRIITNHTSLTAITATVVTGHLHTHHQPTLAVARQSPPGHKLYASPGFTGTQKATTHAYNHKAVIYLRQTSLWANFAG